MVESKWIRGRCFSKGGKYSVSAISDRLFLKEEVRQFDFGATFKVLLVTDVVKLS